MLKDDVGDDKISDPVMSQNPNTPIRSNVCFTAPSPQDYESNYQ